MKNMKKYYGFNGATLVYIGQFDKIADALEASNNEDFFYVTTINDWAIVACEIINKLKEFT